MKQNKTISPEIRNYMREIGRRGGMKNISKGKEFFIKIRRGEKWNKLPVSKV